MTYRPWGRLKWTLSLSGNQNWWFVGTLGAEERSSACRSLLPLYAQLRGEQIARINDIISTKYHQAINDATALRSKELESAGVKSSNVYAFDLMAEHFRIMDFAKLAIANSDSVILDITSFPKRFFFPLLQAFVRSSSVKNLLVTYTSPAGYAEDAPLYEDIDPWRVLPGFGGPPDKPDLWVVSVGFLVESLRDHIGANPSEKMKLLIPFPAPLAVLRRTWESVANLEQGYVDNRFEKYRVDTVDMSSAFDRICSLTGNQHKHVAFAPFGPKPTSAAMCLYAIQKPSSVHYPQPTIYHPNYSIGIRENDPEVAVHAYWVKHDSEQLYQAT